MPTRSSVEEVFTDGIVNVLEQPEFAGGPKLRRVLEVLQRSDFLEQLVPVLTPERRGARDHRPREHERRDARGEPRLRARTGLPIGRSACWACWVRPACRYPRAIPTVRYLSTLMNELITQRARRRTMTEHPPRRRQPPTRTRARSGRIRHAPSLIEKLEGMQSVLERDSRAVQGEEHLRGRQRAAADFANYRRRIDEEREGLSVSSATRC